MRHRAAPRHRVTVLAATLAVVAVVAGCAGQATPTWTFAPIATPTQGPSGAPSSPPAGTPPPPPPSVGADVIDITARNIAFEQTTLTAAAKVPLTIHFDNEDPGIPHDVAIHRGSASGEKLFQGDIITGVASTEYHVPALPAGTYTIICTVHPTLMIATLTTR